MRDELIELVGSVSLDPGNTLNLFGREGNIGVLVLDLHFHKLWILVGL